MSAGYVVEWEFPDGSGGSEKFDNWEDADAAAMRIHPCCRIWLTSEAESDLGYVLEPVSEFFR